MKGVIFLTIILMIFISDLKSYEIKGDSIIVKTFNFDSITTRRGVFEFPPADQYEKVLMHYTLKCDPRTTRDRFDCGEWDYLTYTVVNDTLGRYDSTRNSQFKYVLNNQNPSEIYDTDETPYRIIRSQTIRNNVTNENISKSFTINDNNSILSALSNGKYVIKFDLSDSDLNKIDAIKIPINKTLNSTGTLKNLIVRITTEVDGKVDYNNAKTIFKDDIDYSELGDYLTLPIPDSHVINSNKFVLIFSAESGKELYFNTIQSDKHKIQTYLQENRHAEYNGNSYVEIPKEALDGINETITICFWAKGGNSLPYNTQIFEAVNSKNQRILNAHLPWSNRRIYWDAGNNGGSYDRIEFAASDEIFKNEWAHWAFTKNSATGEMKIYRNGKVIHSGVDKNLTMDKIERMRIASGANSNGRWTGDLNDFAIWDRELIESEIIEFSKGVTLNTNDMLVYYRFNSYINENQIVDESTNNYNGIAVGLPNILKTNPDDFYREFQELEASIEIEFIEGEYEYDVINSTKDTKIDLAKTTLFEYNHESPNTIIPAYRFNSISNELRTPTDTLYINESINYIYNQNMVIIDSIISNKSKIFDNEEIVWFNPSVDYEVDRFITPYGISLDLGDDGFTWKVDVTEFAPILNGFVDLRAGNDQELLDLQFIFIKGTPARDINSIRRIWGSGGNYSQVVTNNAIAPVEMKLDENSEMFRILTRSSGHGFSTTQEEVQRTNNCSEFCQREHSLWINDSQEFAWTGWKECGDNPVYPQGGTWILDRTDWCPGAPVTTYRHELNDLVSPGEDVKFDYEIENPAQYDPHGNWVFTGYLVEYGGFNFQVDAGVLEILSPNKHDEFLRFNPICNNSRVLISNNGAQEITNLELKWVIDGKYEGTYLWEGNIPSLSSTEVNIPLDFEAFENIAYSDRKFHIEILSVNGQADEYERNNSGSSEFNEVDNLFSDTKIEMRASDWSPYNINPPLAYEFKNLSTDEVLASRTSFQNGQNYTEELDLENGCYEFNIQAADGYGLSYWNLTQVASGFLRFKSGENFIENIETEFGNFHYKQFKVGNKPLLQGVGDEINLGDVAEGETVIKSVELEPGNDLGVIIEEMDFTTALVKEFTIDSFEPEVELPYFIPKGEKLTVNIKYEQKRTGIRKGVLLLNSSDGENPNRRIDVIAYVGVNSVEKSMFDEVSIYENPVKNIATLKVNTFNANEKVNIKLFDLMGNEIITFFDGYLGSNKNEFELNFEEFARGKYYIVISNGIDLENLAIILE